MVVLVCWLLVGCPLLGYFGSFCAVRRWRDSWRPYFTPFVVAGLVAAITAVGYDHVPQPSGLGPETRARAIPASALMCAAATVLAGAIGVFDARSDNRGDAAAKPNKAGGEE
jgi:hypothetical protein